MNPKHFQIRVCPNTRTLWLTHAKAGQTRRIKGIEQEVLWALCADLSVTQDEDNATTAIERSVVFADGMPGHCGAGQADLCRAQRRMTTLVDGLLPDKSP